MTDLRYQFEDAEWLAYGSHTLSVASASSFKVNATNVTSLYLTGLRLKIKDTTTLYGTVVSSSFSTDTTVNVELDSGSIASASAVALAIIKPTNRSLPDNLVSNPNMLINGQFRISQRGTTFTSATTPANNDDTYLLDRWTLLSDGNDILDVSQETTTVPDGSYAAIKLDVETANKKAGILQILEARDAKKIINGRASLSFKARVGTNATVDIIRAAVVSCTSAADSVTSDIVTTWNTEGTSPTLIATWTYENSPSSLTLTTTYKKFSIENISIDTASTANVGVFIWIENGDATVGDFVYITDVKLESGSCATPYPVELEADVQARCFRYTVVLNTSTRYALANAYFDTTTVVLLGRVPLPVRMRTTPSVTQSGTTSDFNISRPTSSYASATSLQAASEIGTDSFAVNWTSASASTAGYPTALALNTTAVITVSAEL